MKYLKNNLNIIYQYQIIRTLQLFIFLTEPPVHLWVIHENGSQVATANASANASEYIGPYYVGDTVRLFCVSFGGRAFYEVSFRTK